ncbi:MAG: KpsF/GutQ family sugar-phosphate isomerase [Acidobacteriota bacterium]
MSAPRNVMETEAQAILAAAARMDASIPAAVALIRAQPGKLIFTGIGKSGHLARHLAATFQSTGTPAVFLHPSEASHGDLGICQPGDTAVMISKSGSTAELLRLIPALRQFVGQFVGILGNVASPLAREMDVVLDASVAREGDPHGFMPSASTAVALAVGHALAVALMEARGFTAADFAHLHAGGQLGRTLKLRVQDAMHWAPEIAVVSPDDSLRDVVIQMSRHALGAACVVSPEGALIGLVTDGDVRRAFESHDDIRTLRAAAAMTKSPLTVGPDALLNEALLLMEDRPSQISVLPVVDAAGKCLGLLRLHDIYRPTVSED